MKRDKKTAQNTVTIAQYRDYYCVIANGYAIPMESSEQNLYDEHEVGALSNRLAGYAAQVLAHPDWGWYGWPYWHEVPNLDRPVRTS